jgi:hypothetical protein
VVVVVVHPVYIAFVVFSVAVGAVRVVRQQEVVGIRKGVIIGICCYVGWGRGIFSGTHSIVTAVSVFYLYFR